jgi:hypothetical protein
MPLRIFRKSTVRGRPPGLAGGSNGSRMAHSRSLRSEAVRSTQGRLSQASYASLRLVSCLYLLRYRTSHVVTSAAAIVLVPLCTAFRATFR